MYAIAYLGSINIVRYASEALAGRAIHELLEEAFGDNYGDTEIEEYSIVLI